MLGANLVVLSFTELELWGDRSLRCILDVFVSCDLDLDPMTFIHELVSYCLEIYGKYELLTSSLSKVIV